MAFFVRDFFSFTFSAVAVRATSVDASASDRSERGDVRRVGDGRDELPLIGPVANLVVFFWAPFDPEVVLRRA